MRRLPPFTLLFVLLVCGAASAHTLGERTLKRGSKGSDVVTLQRVLAMKGYSVGTADGLFGRLTKRAVKSFQQRRGLPADGKVGPLTTAALAESWEAQTATVYGPGLFGNLTACGFTLDHRTRGVAHRSLPCGTPVAVYANGLIAIYPVIDRGPMVPGVSLDLTAAAAHKLGVSTTTSVRAGW